MSAAPICIVCGRDLDRPKPLAPLCMNCIEAAAKLVAALFARLRRDDGAPPTTAVDAGCTVCWGTGLDPMTDYFAPRPCGACRGRL